MHRITKSINSLNLKPTNIWENEWFLLTSGDFKENKFNTMTVAWGSLGSMWSRPFAQVVVRPSRYTYKFMNSYNTFTLCHFPKSYKNVLTYLGSTSGKDVPNKIEIAGLTPVAVPHVDAPGFDEADIIIACKKIYWQDMDETHFLQEDIPDKYPQGNDFHRIYFGEICHCEAVL